MGNPVGVRRDFDALEARRFKAAALLKRGLSEEEVARQVGCRRQSVNRWARQVLVAGRASLKKAGRAGRKPKLSAVQLRHVEQGLKRGPEALGFDTSLWTAWRVAALIEETCGVKYHPGHVWRLLKQLGWSCQRPTGRAVARAEAATRDRRR